MLDNELSTSVAWHLPRLYIKCTCKLQSVYLSPSLQVMHSVHSFIDHMPSPKAEHMPSSRVGCIGLQINCLSVCATMAEDVDMFTSTLMPCFAMGCTERNY